ncbi:MAG: hypothetical protein SGJ20_10215 [Planctomycetota bacterium]|nr:hypothetical protein [Planctomycetota bacterium]
MATTILLILAAATSASINFGWKQLDSGGVEYVVQVPPELIDDFEKHGFESDIPPGLRDIRRIRIAVGTGSLPNRGDLAMDRVPTTVFETSQREAEVSTAPPGAAAESTANTNPTPTDTTPSAAKGNEPKPHIANKPELAADSTILGINTLTATQIALLLLLAVIFFLAIAHASLRSRYRALLRQSHV